MSNGVDTFFDKENEAFANDSSDKGQNQQSQPTSDQSHFTAPPTGSMSDDFLAPFLEEAAFGYGSWKDEAGIEAKELVDGFKEIMKNDSFPKGFSVDTFTIDSTSLEYGLAGITVRPPNASVSYLYIYVIRPNSTNVVITNLPQALDEKHIWPEELVTKEEIINHIMDNVRKKTATTNTLFLAGGLVVPAQSIRAGLGDLFRIGYYTCIKDVIQAHPNHVARLKADVGQLVKLNPTIRRSLIKIDSIPDSLDRSPATWQIEVLADRPNGLIKSKKSEALVWGYTDVSPGPIMHPTGVQYFGFIPTYVITDMRHDTKIPVTDRTLFAIATTAEAVAAAWYRDSLVPVGTEGINNIWALRRFVDPNREWEQGNIPSMDPPQNEMSRDIEMDMLISPNMMSVVMDVAPGDQKAWFMDSFLGLGSRDAQQRSMAEMDILTACDNLTEGRFGKIWNSMPNKPAIAATNMVPVGYLHMQNGDVRDMRTLTNLTYATILAANAENGYDINTLRQKIIMWSDYMNADLRNDRFHLTNWVKSISEIDPTLEITGWTHRISFSMDFITVLLQAMSENGYRPMFDGEQTNVGGPNSLRSAIIQNAGMLPPSLRPQAAYNPGVMYGYPPQPGYGQQPMYGQPGVPPQYNAPYPPQTPPPTK